MRIISKERDYYDCMMNQMCDRSIVFVRKQSDPIESPFKKMGCLCSYEEHTYRGGFLEEYFFMGVGFLFFCGNVYPYVMIGDKVYYDMDSLPHVISTGHRRRALKEGAKAYARIWFEQRKVYSGLHWCPDEERSVRAHLKHHKPDFVMDQKALVEYALKNGVAYYSTFYNDRNGDYVVHYPNLKELTFFRVLPPLEAFQRIQMYLTNELAREKQMPEEPISDKLKAETHGFDKWSFRKEASSSKRKK